MSTRNCSDCGKEHRIQGEPNLCIPCRAIALGLSEGEVRSILDQYNDRGSAYDGEIRDRDYWNRFNLEV